MGNVSYAYDVKVEGVYYNLYEYDKTARVTEGNKECSGDIVIPSVITNEGIDYTVTGISMYAFADNDYISKIAIPNTVSFIGVGAFDGCSGLKECVLSNSITSIAAKTFNNCYSLKDIIIPNSVETIGERAFWQCEGLLSITIPSSVCDIEGVSMFNNCWGLEEIIVDKNNKSYSSENGVLFNKDKSILLACPKAKNEKFEIPSSVKIIQHGAFKWSDLSEILIPDGIEVIEYDAFYSTKTKSFDIPESVNNIGSEAFCNCPYLEEVYVHWKTPLEIEEENLFYSGDVFDSEALDAMTLYVPQGCVEAYKKVAPWNLFGKIVESLPGAVENINSDSVDLPCEAFNLTGARVAEAESLELLKNSLDKGMYVVRFANGVSQKIVKF